MCRETDITHKYRGRSPSRDIERTIAELAGRQHGRIARWQLRQLGLSERAIDYRLERFRLHIEYPGVYAVGHPAPTRAGHWMAAVLAGGPGAVLGHFAAAAHLGMVRGAPSTTDITAPRDLHNRGGLRFHCVVLPHDEMTVHQGIPVTTAPRTLFDIAASLPLARGATRPPRRLEAALEQADVLRLWDELSLPALLDRYPRRPGSRAVRLARGGVERDAQRARRCIRRVRGRKGSRGSTRLGRVRTDPFSAAPS